MLYFTRSAMLRCQSLRTPLPRIPQTPRKALPTRSFTTTVLVAAKKPFSRPPVLRTPPKSTNVIPPSQTYQSYTAKLASSSTPTPLYIAPSHTLYMVSAYSGAAFCISYAGFSYLANVVSPPAGLSTWVPIAFAGICFMMAAMGGWLLFAPAYLIRSITAHPVKSIVANGPSFLRVDIELRRMLPLPFLPPRVVSASPAELQLSQSIYVPPSRPVTAAERFAAARRQAEEQEAERKKSILLAPFRDASKAFHGLFVAIRRIWSREGFLKLQVKGKAYKLDITDGWALDEGRALDRICKVQPS